MPVAVDPKSARPCVSVCHGDGFTIVECHRVPQAAQPPATRPWNGPSATRGSMSWSAGTQHSSPRQVPCRGLDLAGPGNLPGSEACRSPGPAGAHIAPRRVSSDVIFQSCKPLLSGSRVSEVTLSLERPSRQTPLAGVLMLWLGRPGKLLLPGPCLLGPASSSCRGLVLNAWSSLGQKGPWRLLALPWPALPRRATTARAQVRGTRVPLL